MAAYQTRADLLHDDAAIPAFDKTHVGIDECKPESNVIIFDFVKALLTLFWIFLCDWDLALQNIQINECLQILR